MLNITYYQHSSKYGDINGFLCVLCSQEEKMGKEAEIKRKLQELKQNYDALSGLEEEQFDLA